MALLVLGLALWVAFHALPLSMRQRRAALIERWGEARVKIGVALGLALSVLSMILGWRSAEFVPVYDPPSFGRHVTHLFVLIAFLLFAGSNKNDLKLWVRHPQLTGLAFWAVGHLASNGDLRSVLLFGVLGLWAIAAMAIINRRDGDWRKPEPVGLRRSLINTAAGVVAYLAVALAHEYLFGVNPFVG